MGNEKIVSCPRCDKNSLKNPIGGNAISIEDNKTFICTDCGINESRMMWFKAKGMRDNIPKEQIELTNNFRKKLGLGVLS